MTSAPPLRPPIGQHRWRFFRAGGLDQVRLETGADLANLEHLDQKLWVALACPVSGLEFDERTLRWIDADADGRVRVPEILEALRFCKDVLRSLDGLLLGTDVVPLASVRSDTEAGRKILGSARQILLALGRPDAETIGLAETADTAAIFAKTQFNGDGIVTPRSAEDPELAQILTEAITAVGSTVDRSGEPGLDQPRLDAFFAELAAYDAWQSKRALPGVLALGDDTDAAAAALLAIRAKIDDYFARCRVTAFDARAQAALNHGETDYALLAGRDLSAGATETAGLPLHRIAPGRPLPLVGELNPAWAPAAASLRERVTLPLLGDPPELTEADWAHVQQTFAPYLAWQAEKPVTGVEVLGIERVRAVLASDAQARLTVLVERDLAFADDFDSITHVAKLALLHRDLGRLLKNFASFEDFYAPGQMAIFQAGTLYLDGRSCELCVRVTDAGKHAAMAGLSKCYLAYCTCTRPGGQVMQIAAVFSAGDSDFLMVGRNGLFYDRAGRDWDATITRVVENPISLREAFYAPYKKFVRFVEDQVGKRAAAADAASTSKLAGAADPVARPGFDLSTVALIGVAVSGAAAVVGGLLEAFFGLGMWMPIGMLGIVLLISGPSLLIAGLKLRQRNLGPVLDANGWAINGRVAVNIPFGGSLTRIPVFPAGSERRFVDPYEPRRSPLVTVARILAGLALVVGAAAFGYHQGWMPQVAEQYLAILGVPRHLEREKRFAQLAVDEQQAVVASATEQVASARAALDARLATGEPADGKLTRAEARMERAEAKLVRAEDKLDRYELRLEVASEALDVAIDADETRLASVDVTDGP